MAIKKISLAIEIPLAILSFLFAKINKFLIGNLYYVYLTINKNKANQWRVIDNNLVASNLNLAVLMTKAPRWNTHAIIGTLGPFSLENTLNLDSKSANDSTKSWIAIFYDFPNYKTISTIESNQINSANDWQSIQLPKGKYTIGLRYYNYSQNLVLPAVKIDGKIFTVAKKIPSDSNQFYHKLMERKNFYFLALHYYIYTILKLRKYLPESFVEKEFLPVGATDTQFFYDSLDIGESLHIEIDQLTLLKYDTYITVYDRSSLPVSWFQITDLISKTKPFHGKSYYLIRVKSDNISQDKFSTVNIKLTKTK